MMSPSVCEGTVCVLIILYKGCYDGDAMYHEALFSDKCC